LSEEQRPEKREASDARVFPLAPMCTLMRAVTVVLLFLPLLVGAALACTPIPFLGACTFASLALLYLYVWLWWRPTHFALDDAGLTIRWPARRARVPWDRIGDAREVTSRELREELGIAARVGIGGLWGGFGWLWSSRRGWLDLYVSRTDGMVLVEGKGRRPLLVTPADPAGFSRALRTRV
jgi:hypothetical protein